jgi:hypothetical protein
MSANERVFGLQVFPAEFEGIGPALRTWLDDAQALVATVLHARGLDDWPDQKRGRRLIVELNPVRGNVPMRVVKADQAGWESSLREVESLSSLLLHMWDGPESESLAAIPPLVQLYYNGTGLEGSMATIQLSFAREFVDDQLLPTVQTGLKALFHTSAVGLHIQSGAIGYATDDEPEMDEVFKYAVETAWEMAESVPGCHWGTYLTEEHIRSLGHEWSSLDPSVVHAIEPVGGTTGPWFVQATKAMSSPRPSAAWCRLIDRLRLRWDEASVRSVRYPLRGDPDSDAGLMYERMPRAPRHDWQHPTRATVAFRSGWGGEAAVDPAFVDFDFRHPLTSSQIASIRAILSEVVDWVHPDGQVSFVSEPNDLGEGNSVEIWMDAGGLGPDGLAAVANQLAFEVESVADLYRLSIGGPPIERHSGPSAP